MVEGKSQGVEARWTARFTGETLQGLDEPCPLVTRVRGQVWLLARSQGVLRPLPELGQDTGSAREVLADNGHVLMLERYSTNYSPGTPPEERRRNLGIYRLRLSDMSLQRAAIDLPDGLSQHTIAAAPDGRCAVVARNWSLPIDEQAAKTPVELHALQVSAARCTLTLVDFDNGTADELDVVEGHAGSGRGDDLRIQWSPDGETLAVWALLWPNRSLPPGVTRLYDMASMRLTRIVTGGVLVGSRSWSPDSTKLLRNLEEGVVVHDLTTGQDLPIPSLPGPRPIDHGGGRHRILGFADEAHLYTATLGSGPSMIIWRTPLDSGDAEPLCRCVGSSPYPTLGPIPTDYWS